MVGMGIGAAVNGFVSKRLYDSQCPVDSVLRKKQVDVILGAMEWIGHVVRPLRESLQHEIVHPV